MAIEKFLSTVRTRERKTRKTEVYNFTPEDEAMLQNWQIQNLEKSPPTRDLMMLHAQMKQVSAVNESMLSKYLREVRREAGSQWG